MHSRVTDFEGTMWIFGLRYSHNLFLVYHFHKGIVKLFEGICITFVGDMKRNYMSGGASDASDAPPLPTYIGLKLSPITEIINQL